MLAEKWTCEHSSNILGNEITVNTIKTELHKEPNQTWFIFGGTGTGKSNMISCILKEEKFKSTIFDASFKRSVKSIKIKVNEVISHSHFCKNAIVFDEFEHVVEENFGAAVLIDLIKTIKNVPVFVIMNNSVKLRVLKLCTKFKYHIHDMTSPHESILIKYIRKIAKREHLKISKKNIVHRIKFFQTDVRKLINSIKVPFDESESQLSFFVKNDNLSTVNYVLENKESLNSKIKSIESDIFASVPIVHENYIIITATSSHAKISRLMSECDIFHTYIYATQAWDLLFTCAICGVLIPCSLAHKQRVNKYGTILSRMSNAQTKDKAVKTLMKSLNVSTLSQLHACKLLQKSLNINKKTTTSLNNIVKF